MDQLHVKAAIDLSHRSAQDQDAFYQQHSLAWWHRLKRAAHVRMSHTPTQQTRRDVLGTPI